MDIPPKLKEENRKLADYLSQHGFKNIDKVLKPTLDKWREVEVNIVVTGDSGAGKSSFINAVLGMEPTEKGAAKVGVTETTKDQTSYSPPVNPKLKLWDTPGVGTLNQRAAEYWDKFELGKFDAYLIFSSGRFTENDFHLAAKVHKAGKSYFFVRTKIDVDLSNAVFDQGSEPLTPEEEREKLLSIRGDCLEGLEVVKGNLVDVFMISNHSPGKWDFSRLTDAICAKLPDLQQESLRLTLRATSTEMLDKKVEILRGNIWKVASLSAGVALIPLPGLSIGVDIAIMINEISQYRSLLGIPVEETTAFAMLKAPAQQCIRETFARMTTPEGIKNLLKHYATEQVLEEVSRCVPFVGPVIAGSLSFACTYRCLDHCLETMKETARLTMNETLDIPHTD